MRIMMDCDTGIDDALAILYLLGSPDAELIGVTGVSAMCRRVWLYATAAACWTALGGRISLCMKVPANRHIGSPALGP